MTRPTIIVAAAVNEPHTLAHCLARSPDISSGALPLATYTGYRSASAAYNAAIAAHPAADCIVFAHQDVYLPAGTRDRLLTALEHLNSSAPDWAIAGCIGGTAQHALVGDIWCSGHNRRLGTAVDAPIAVETLDEVLVILRTQSGMRFDPALPGFHLYAADIVLSAAAAGFSTWVINLPIVHHSRPVISLGGDYRTAYRFMQRKWARRLPVHNLCCPLEHGPWRYLVTEARLLWKHRHTRGRPEPVGDPVEHARATGYEPVPFCATT